MDESTDLPRNHLQALEPVGRPSTESINPLNIGNDRDMCIASGTKGADSFPGYDSSQNVYPSSAKILNDDNAIYTVQHV